MHSLLHILHLEDDVADAQLTKETLEAGGLVCDVTRVRTESAFLAALQQEGIDLILADYSLPSFDGLSALTITLQHRPELPFIFVSGAMGEDLAVEALKIGATDYVLKTRLSRLVPAVRRALREANERAELRRAERELQDRETSQGVALVFDLTEHKRAEGQLNLRLLVDSIPAPVAVMTPSGEVESVNQPNLEYFGTTLEDLKKWGTSDAVHPEDLPHAIEIWMEAIRTGQPYDIKQRLRRFDGVYRWFDVRGFPLRDPDGRILNWCVLLTDIDDRERAEEALRVIVETATDAVVSADERGAIQFANPAITRVFGYDPAELIGKPLTVLMPEFMRKLHENGFKRYLATGQRHINWQGTEFTGQRKNGQEFPVEVSFGESVTESGHSFTGFIRDISARKRVEENLRRSEQRWRAVFENSAIGVASRT